MRGPYRVNKGFLDDFDATIPLGEFRGIEFEIRSVIWCYRGTVRQFEVGLWAVVDDVRFEVASVDCCDSSIHVHRLRRSSPRDRQRDRRLIVELHEGDPDRHVFEVTWMEWHDEPVSEDETRPIFTRPDDQTIGEQVVHMRAVERRRYQDYLRSGGASQSRYRTYSTRELERELASA